MTDPVSVGTSREEGAERAIRVGLAEYDRATNDRARREIASELRDNYLDDVRLLLSRLDESRAELSSLRESLEGVKQKADRLDGLLGSLEKMPFLDFRIENGRITVDVAPAGRYVSFDALCAAIGPYVVGSGDLATQTATPVADDGGPADPPVPSSGAVSSSDTPAEPDCDDECGKCDGSYCATHFNAPCDCDTADRHVVSSSDTEREDSNG